MNSVPIIIDKGNYEIPKPQITVHPIFSFGQLLGYLLIVRSTLGISYTSEFMGKMFQAAQITHERFLIIDYSCKIFFDIFQTELPRTSGGKLKLMLKFIYFEKATKFCEISTIDLTVTT